MLFSKRILIISFMVLILMIIIFVLLYIDFCKQESTLSILERHLQIKIPLATHVVASEYNKEEDSLLIKIVINKEDINEFKNELNFKYNSREPTKDDYIHINNFYKTYSWWTLDGGLIDNFYKYLTGKKTKYGDTTRDIQIYLSKLIKGRCILLIRT